MPVVLTPADCQSIQAVNAQRQPLSNAALIVDGVLIGIFVLLAALTVVLFVRYEKTSPQLKVRGLALLVSATFGYTCLLCAIPVWHVRRWAHARRGLTLPRTGHVCHLSMPAQPPVLDARRRAAGQQVRSTMMGGLTYPHIARPRDC